MRNAFFILSAVMFVVVSTGYGQINTTAGAHVPNHGRVNSINGRENTIMWEIADGAQSGALIPAQVNEFKRRFNLIQAQKTNAMTEHQGGLTYSEWKDLKNQEERLEHDIQSNRWKH